MPPGIEPKFKTVLAPGVTGTTETAQVDDGGPVWGKKSTPTDNRVDVNQNTNPVKPSPKKRMTAAEKRAAGIPVKPRAKPQKSS